MTFDTYWERLLKRNPSLSIRDEKDKMTMVVASFKRSLRAAFEEGRVEGAAQGRASVAPVDDRGLMEKLFGRH